MADDLPASPGEQGSGQTYSTSNSLKAAPPDRVA